MKIGDRVICIDARSTKVLEENKIYIIEDYSGGVFINGYYAWRFISLKEVRKKKLENLDSWRE